MTGRVLVAGIGNIFLGDDGFGVAVANRLAELALPAGVTAADYGIRGLHLAYEILDGDYAATILVDAVPRGEPPGTLCVIDAGQAGADVGVFDAHGMTPDVVLGLVRRLGGDPGRVLVVGCEPAAVAEGIGLSPQVAAAVPAAVRTVAELIGDLTGTPVPATGFRQDSSAHHV